MVLLSVVILSGPVELPSLILPGPPLIRKSRFFFCSPSPFHHPCCPYAESCRRQKSNHVTNVRIQCDWVQLTMHIYQDIQCTTARDLLQERTVRKVTTQHRREQTFLPKVLGFRPFLQLLRG